MMISFVAFYLNQKLLKKLLKIYAFY